MIKRYLFIFIFFNSCSSIDYSYFADLKNYYSKNKILVDQSFIDKQDYSFIKVSNKKNDAVFILSRLISLECMNGLEATTRALKLKMG